MLRSSFSGKRGFTLVELLVVIAIIGILVGLLLPAVQAAREAARRMSCSNNVKQIALAMHNYHDTYKTFPCFLTRNGQNSYWRGYSAFTAILPQMEQGPLYDAVVAGSNSFLFNWDEGGAAFANLYNARASRVPAFICPSARKFNTNGTGWSNGPGCNYGVSFGSTLEWDDFRQQNGFFRGQSDTNKNSKCSTGMSDIIDGTSNTLMLSEHLSGDDNGNFLMGGQTSEPRIGSAFVGAVQYPSVAEIETFGIACKAITAHNSQNGGQWMSPQPTQTALNTVAPPNWQYPNCQTSGSGFASDRDGIYTARSQHSGGVNAAYGDGSVRFITQTIDVKTYQFIGGRDDGQVVSGPE